MKRGNWGRYFLYFFFIILITHLSGCGGSSGLNSDGIGVQTLPVTLSKLIDGVDATSVALEGNGGSSLVTGPFQTATSAFGTVSYTLRNTGVSSTILLTTVDEVIAFEETSTDGEFEIPSQYVGEDLFLYVKEDAESDTASYPVVVKAYDDDDLDKVVSVLLTNAHEDGRQNIDINVDLAVTDESVYFTYEDTSGDQFIGTVDVRGGDFDEFTEIDESIQQITVQDDLLFAVDQDTLGMQIFGANGNLIYSEVDDSDNSELIPNGERYTRRAYTVNSDTEWLAVQRKVSAESDVQTPVFINIQDTDEEIVPDIAGIANEGFLNMDFNDDELFISSLTQQSVERLDLSDLLNGGSTVVTAEEIVAGNAGEIVFNPDRNEIIYSCEDDDDVGNYLSNLCSYNLSTETKTVLVDEGAGTFLVNIRVSADGRFAFWEHNRNPEVGEINPLGYYELATGINGYAILGGSPTPDMIDERFFSFVTCDSNGDSVCDDDDNGGIQIGIVNLENLGFEF